MKTLSPRLSPKLVALLLMGVKSCGSYQPDEALVEVEEQLTSPEYSLAFDFLAWVCQNNVAFGAANIQERFAQYRESL